MNKQLDAEIVVAEFPWKKNYGETTCRVTIRKPQQVRRVYIDPAEQKGITFRVEELPEIIEALQDALKIMHETPE